MKWKNTSDFGCAMLIVLMIHSVVADALILFVGLASVSYDEIAGPILVYFVASVFIGAALAALCALIVRKDPDGLKLCRNLLIVRVAACLVLINAAPQIIEHWHISLERVNTGDMVLGITVLSVIASAAQCFAACFVATLIYDNLSPPMPVKSAAVYSRDSLYSSPTKQYDPADDPDFNWNIGFTSVATENNTDFLDDHDYSHIFEDTNW